MDEKRKLVGETVRNSAIIIIILQVIAVVAAIILPSTHPQALPVCIIVIGLLALVLLYELFDGLGVLINFQQLTVEELAKQTEQIKLQTETAQETARRSGTDIMELKESIDSLRATISGMKGNAPVTDAPEASEPQPPKHRHIPGTVRCPKCGSLNPDYKQFCEQCEESLM